MGICDGRTAIVTGAGRGIGRSHALAFGREGANVVVNDVDRDVARSVVDEIVAGGGAAVANADDVGSWSGAESMVKAAIDAFGKLDTLVCNAGNLRDRMLVNMTEEDWDSVIEVHLRGHFCPTRHAAAYWREQVKAEKTVNAAIVNTSSTSGVLGNAGQTNYGAAKAGIATFSTICAMELGRYGVRSNAITPMARTRLTEQTPGMEDVIKPPDAGQFDMWSAANVAPMVAYLSTADCPFTGETFFVEGDVVARYQPHVIAEKIKNDGERWTVEQLATAAQGLRPKGKRRGGPGEIAIAAGE